MKRLLVAGAGLTLALSVLWVGFAGAANVRSGQAPHIMKDEVINGTLYSAGGDVKIEGKIEGDLMCAGQNVEVTGEIEGDVLCAGQNVTIRGTVHGDVRIIGQNTTVSGDVKGSVTSVGQNMNIDSTAVIARDVTIIGQQVGLGGTIGRDVEAIGSVSVASNAKIGRDLDTTSQQVSLRNGTEIAGTFMYVSQNDAKVDSGAKIAGKTEHKIPENDQEADPSGAAYVSSVAIAFSSFFMLGLALLLGVPRLSRAATNAIKTSPLATVGAGFAGLFVPPFIATMLFISVVGIPLAVVLFMAWVTALLTGLVFSAQTIGQLIITKLKWQDKWREFAGLVLGLFVVFLGALLPYVGSVIIMLAVVWGMGAQVYLLIKRRDTSAPAHQETK